MSIIYEALRKIEKKEEKPDILPENSQFIHKHSKRNFLLIFLSIALFSIAFFSFKSLQTKTIKIGAYQNKKINSFLEKQIDKINETVSLQKNELAKKDSSNLVYGISDKNKPVDYRIQGIIYDQQNPLVIINGKQLGIGQDVEGAKVISISKQGVELENNGNKIYIPLED